MPENCRGGVEDFTCSEGHFGALCEACDLYGTKWPETYRKINIRLNWIFCSDLRYSNAGDYSCGKCSEVEGNTLKVVFTNIYILITLGFSVKSMVKNIRGQIMAAALSKNIYFSYLNVFSEILWKKL